MKKGLTVQRTILLYIWLCGREFKCFISLCSVLSAFHKAREFHSSLVRKYSCVTSAHPPHHACYEKHKLRRHPKSWISKIWFPSEFLFHRHIFWWNHRHSVRDIVSSNIEIGPSLSHCCHSVAIWRRSKWFKLSHRMCACLCRAQLTNRSIKQTIQTLFKLLRESILFDF